MANVLFRRGTQTYIDNNVPLVDGQVIFNETDQAIYLDSADSGTLTRTRYGGGNLSRSDVDATLSTSSINPIQNQAVANAINTLDTKVSKTEVLISIVENGNTCTHTGGISAGQYVIWKGNLYTADSNISVGATFASSGGSKNLTAVPNGGLNNILSKTNTSASITHHNSVMYFTKSLNTVFMRLSGDWKNTLPVSGSANVGTVPEGYRPLIGFTIAEQSTSGGQIAMTIATDGTIFVNNYFTTAQAHDGKYTACWIC